MPFNAAAAEARGAIVGVLASWSGMVAQERRLTPPRREVGPLAGFLLGNADWLAAHSSVAEATDEIARLVRRARRAVSAEDFPRRVPVGHCVHQGCQGRLYALLGGDGRLAGPTGGAGPEVACDADREHRWPDHEWRELSTRMRPAAATAVRWLSVGDIVHLWRATPGTVYRLASQRGWRRCSHGGRTYYHEGDVEGSFAAIAARRDQAG